MIHKTEITGESYLFFAFLGHRLSCIVDDRVILSSFSRVSGMINHDVKYEFNFGLARDILCEMEKI